MKPIPDSLLLETAEIAATLIGLLLVAVFFYLETGFRRLTAIGPEVRSFLKATTKLIVFQYSMVVGLSLGLVALRSLWVTVLFLLLSVAIVAGLVEFILRSRSLSREVRHALRVQPVLAWPMVLAPLALPWLLDGWEPGREALTWTLFLEGAVAFMNTVSLLLLTFDLAAIEEAAAHAKAHPKR